MKLQQLSLPECAQASGLVVVIDVIRAFTTAAYAFAAGARQIILVSEVEEALALHRKHPDYLLMGEVGAIKAAGFHFGNSPGDVTNETLHGKTLVQRTSSGTQGAVRCRHAEQMLISSFVVAQATSERIRQLSPTEVTFINTGRHNGDEDRALADYLSGRLIDERCDPAPYLERVKTSPNGLRCQDPEFPHLSHADLDAVLQVDRFPFAMQVFSENEQLVVRPVDSKGQPVVIN